MPIDPIAEKVLEDAKASGRPNAHLLPVPTARRHFESAYRTLARPPVHRVVDVAIPTRDGRTIPGRLYQPDATAPPLTIYLHGGGWLLGSIDTHDVPTRLLATAAGSAVLSVGYRRAPEWRFPTAVEDAVDALRWAADPASGLPVDRGRIAVAGDSAGGNLAGAVARYARDTASAPPVRHQLLIYPVTTTDLDRGIDPAYDGVVLERDELQWHQDNYLPSPRQAADPRVNLLDAELTGLPEATVILAECDPIRPQGERYACALRAAGVPVLTHTTPGMIHGFFGLTELYPAAAEAMAVAGERLRRAFQP